MYKCSLQNIGLAHIKHHYFPFFHSVKQIIQLFEVKYIFRLLLCEILDKPLIFCHYYHLLDPAKYHRRSQESHHTEVHITTRRFTSPHGGSHHQTEVHITTRRFTSSHGGLPHHTKVYITTRRFTSPYGGSHHHTEVCIITRRFTSSYGSLHHHTEVNIITRKFTSPHEG